MAGLGKLICLLIAFFVFGFVFGSLSDYISKFKNKSSLAEYLTLRRKEDTITVPWHVYDEIYDAAMKSGHLRRFSDCKYIKYYPRGYGYEEYTIIPDRYVDYKNDIKLRKKEISDRVLKDIKNKVGGVNDKHK